MTKKHLENRLRIILHKADVPFLSPDTNNLIHQGFQKKNIRSTIPGIDFLLVLLKTHRTMFLLYIICTAFLLMLMGKLFGNSDPDIYTVLAEGKLTATLAGCSAVLGTNRSRKYRMHEVEAAAGITPFRHLAMVSLVPVSGSLLMFSAVLLKVLLEINRNRNLIVVSSIFFYLLVPAMTVNIRLYCPKLNPEKGIFLSSAFLLLLQIVSWRKIHADPLSYSLLFSWLTLAFTAAVLARGLLAIQKKQINEFTEEC